LRTEHFAGDNIEILVARAPQLFGCERSKTVPFVAERLDRFFIGIQVSGNKRSDACFTDANFTERS
jgi:hypothetical protein